MQSVTQQEYPNIEHIIIDGASTDETIALAEKWLRHGGKIFSEPDTGLYDAMNKGVARATGDIIAFLNSDDFYAANDVIGKVIAVFDSNPALNAVFGDVALFKSETPNVFFRRYNSGVFRPSRVRWGWMPAHPAMFLRKSVCEIVGPFREDFKIAADFEFVARAVAKNAFVYQHIPLVLVHMMAGGVSTRGISSNLLINIEMLRACKINGIYSNIAMILTKYPLKLLEYVK